MTREELDRLRGLAANATPGEWEWSASRLIVRHGDQVTHFVLYPTHEYETGCAIEGSIDDLDYITAANPSTITALLDHIDSLERERDKLEREAKAGRELREAVGNICCDWPHDPNTDIDNCCKTYDTATKETGQ